jgi:surfeit locus 1 family protein
MSFLAQVRAEDDESASTEYPLKPPVASVADFKTTPAIHAGYAATWFGLSGSGIYMTRKLITRGRA